MQGGRKGRRMLRVSGDYAAPPLQVRQECCQGLALYSSLPSPRCPLRLPLGTMSDDIPCPAACSKIASLSCPVSARSLSAVTPPISATACVFSRTLPQNDLSRATCRGQGSRKGGAGPDSQSAGFFLFFPVFPSFFACPAYSMWYRYLKGWPMGQRKDFSSLPRRKHYGLCE